MTLKCVEGYWVARNTEILLLTYSFDAIRLID